MVIPAVQFESQGYHPSLDIERIPQAGIALDCCRMVGTMKVSHAWHACRASLGYMSTFEDVEAFSLFLQRAYTDRPVGK